MLFIFLFTNIVIAGDGEDTLTILNNYYLESINEDLDKYYDTIFTSHYTEKELEARKKATIQIWDYFDTISYRITNLEMTLNDNEAIIFYILNSKIQDLETKEIISIERETAAILFKDQNNWKVYATMPRSTFDIRMSVFATDLDIICENCEVKYEDPSIVEKVSNFFTGKIDADIYAEKPAKCGNGICEEKENNYECPSDCKDYGYCDYDVMQILEIEKINVKHELNNSDIPEFVKNILSKDAIFDLHIIDSDRHEYLTLVNGQFDYKEPKITYEEFCTINGCKNIKFYNNEFNPEKIDYIISTDSCSYQDLTTEKLDFIDAFTTGKIKIEGGTIFSKIKTNIGNIVFKIYNWFNKEPEQIIKEPINEIKPYTPKINISSEEGETEEIINEEKRIISNEIVFEAENCELNNKGANSFIGKTSRGPGELYLGDKGAFALCKIDSTLSAEVNVYLRVSDDGKHASGSRSVIFEINDQTLNYNHVSKNYIQNGDFWGVEYLGKATLTKGENIIKITKKELTSAAFTLDSITFTPNKN